jgi:glutamate racemase
LEIGQFCGIFCLFWAVFRENQAKLRMSDPKTAPIGVFDSGYGGLTVLKEISLKLPQHDFIYLGDNARSPYGNRSFESVYAYTLECVQKLFGMGCRLVVLACNTASAKALRTIQQKDLPRIDPSRRVLGVIRPTTEIIGHYSKSRHVGILGTAGTVNSGSYVVEIEKFFPDLTIHQEACPMWVPLIENNEFDTEGGAYFIRRHVQKLLAQHSDIDAIILACTHYPLILRQIRSQVPEHVKLISQGPVVAAGLEEYLRRHPEMAAHCSTNGKLSFYTTDQPEVFDKMATVFFGRAVSSQHLAIG